MADPTVSRDTPEAQTNANALIPAQAQALQLAHVRQAHQTELIEDYVELIADLIAVKGRARTVELSRRIGVAPATVTKMLRRLQTTGLIQTKPYRAIFLTEDGEHMARMSCHRHRVVLHFLRALGVNDINARKDAEGIEHHVGTETLERMQHFIARQSAGPTD